MKRAFKILCGVLVAIIALMLIVPALLSGKIGDIVKKEANEMVDATVDFAKLDMSLFRHFPKASLDLEDFSVTGKGVFEGQKLVAASRIEVVVDMLSIFGDSFEVSKIILNRPEIYGRITADGKANWDIMPSSDDEAAKAEESDDAPSSFRLSITDLRIKEATIRYTDDSSRIHFHTSPLDIALSGNLSAAQTVIDTKVSAADITFVSDSTTLAKGITATLTAKIDADLQNNKYTLSDNLLSVNAVKARLNGWVQLAGENIDTDLSLDCSGNNFKDILSLVPAFYTKDFADLTTTGDVSLTAWVRGRMTADTYPAFALDVKVADGSFKYAALPKSVSGIALQASVRNSGGSLDDTIVDVPLFLVSFGGHTLSAKASVATPLSDLAFKASANGKIDLGAIKEVYPLGDEMTLNGIITANVSAAGRMSQIEKQAFDKMQVSGSVGIEGMAVKLASLPAITIDDAYAAVSPATATLDRLNVKVGNSDIAAKGSVSNYWGYILQNKTLSGSLTVRSALLDLNEIMAAMGNDTAEETEQNEPTEQPTATEPNAAEALSVVEVPKNLNLRLDSTFDKVLFEKMVIDNLKGIITLRNGELTLDRLAMEMFRGKATVSAQYSTADVDTPKVKLNAAFSEASYRTTFDQLELMQAIAPIFKDMDGSYSMSLDAALSLDKQMNPIAKSVNGKGKLTSGKLQLGNVKALSALSKALGENTLGTLQTTEPTLVSFTIKDGDLTTKPFDIRLGKVKLNLSGTTSLDQTIDYNAAIALPDNLTANAKIGGTFAQPTVRLDTKKMAEQALASVGITQESVNAELQKQADALIAEAEKAGAKLVEAAQAERQKLIDKTTNPLTRLAAEKAGDKLVAEAQKQSANLVAEARKKADALLKR